LGEATAVKGTKEGWKKEGWEEGIANHHTSRTTLANLTQKTADQILKPFCVNFLRVCTESIDRLT
jgi:hypothetical protein